MKIAIATEGGRVSAHFGRCPVYTLAVVQDGRLVSREEIPNPGHQPGFLPRFLSDMGIEVIIAGGMGPRAQGLFAERNIRTLTGVMGPVDEVIQKFLRDELRAGPDLCDHEHLPEHACGHGQPAQSGEPEAFADGKILVSAAGPDLDSDLAPNFGRAPYFLIVDLATLRFEAVANSHAGAAHGAGIQAAQTAAAHSVTAVLTGQVGPNAARVLEAAGIKVLAAEVGPVRQALARLGRA
jgi:predicted Fe-Mo cluster-binding NifX family protein